MGTDSTMAVSLCSRREQVSPALYFNKKKSDPMVCREFLMDWLAIALTKFYNVTVVVPRWLLIVITGSIGSVLVNLLHSGKKTPQKDAAPSAKSVTAAETSSSPSTTSVPSSSTTTTKAGSAKQRKNKK